MTTSSNFGNMFSVLVASAFLPFLPMLAIQILINNLLYDISQISLPWDRMDEDWLKEQRQWGIRGIARFTILIGPISSIFDITTYLGVWFIFGANSLATQGLFHRLVRREPAHANAHRAHDPHGKNPFRSKHSRQAGAFVDELHYADRLSHPIHAVWEDRRHGPSAAGYWPFLATTLFVYCLLTQFCKVLYIREFRE